MLYLALHTEHWPRIAPCPRNMQTDSTVGLYARMITEAVATSMRRVIAAEAITNVEDRIALNSLSS